MGRVATKKKHLVAAIALERLSIFELAVAAEVFGFDRPELGVDWYDFAVCAEEPGLQPTKASFAITAPHGLDVVADDADTVVVPATPDVHGDPSPALVDAIRRAHERKARIMSVCSGAFVLAAAGLLDGKRATTHWMYADLLAERYPKVHVDPMVLYIDEGDVLTSAGTAAGIDLCLYVVRKDHGAAIANAVARRMVVPPHRDGGQQQFVDHPGPGEQCDPDEPLHAVLEELADDPTQDVTVDELARRAHMSPRTFARRFRQVTGTTPYRWILDQRLLLAQRLLEETDLSVERIAQETGFGAAVTLRTHFSRWSGTSPQTYRQTWALARSR
jgi:AraC family transcriptional activator FtrA